MTTGFIFDIKRFSLHDGPGIRTTVFLKGCPLTCAWCHNPESQRREPQMMLRPSRCIACGACVAECAQEAVTWVGDGVVTDRALCIECGACTAVCAAEAREVIGREVAVTDVMAEVIRDVAFFDESGGGVTFSGGEPLLQGAFVRALLHACKTQELHTVVDTSGAVAWKTLDSIRPLVDLFLYDVKLVDSARHKAATGAGNGQILENLRRLAAAGAAIQLRLALVPGWNDDEVNLRATAALANSLEGVLGISLLPFHNAARDKYGRLGIEYELEGVREPTEEEIATGRGAAARVWLAGNSGQMKKGDVEGSRMISGCTRTSSVVKNAKGVGSREAGAFCIWRQVRSKAAIGGLLAGQVRGDLIRLASDQNELIADRPHSRRWNQV